MQYRRGGKRRAGEGEGEERRRGRWRERGGVGTHTHTQLLVVGEVCVVVVAALLFG
jgi:hypothetical protein